MTQEANDTNPQAPGRTFLCVVDQSEELGKALYFACRRANNTGGRIALLYVLEPAEFQHWAAVGNLMREERRQEAEEMLNVVANVVKKRTNKMPELYIREGNITEELIKLINEEKHISLLVLGAATGQEGPGPIVTTLISKMAGRLRVPVTVVPGNLSDEQIDAIT
jgi:nucleotide-binding universal stress UspA family protein